MIFLYQNGIVSIAVDAISVKDSRIEFSAGSYTLQGVLHTQAVRPAAVILRRYYQGKVVSVIYGLGSLATTLRKAIKRLCQSHKLGSGFAVVYIFCFIISAKESSEDALCTTY